MKKTARIVDSFIDRWRNATSRKRFDIYVVARDYIVDSCKFVVATGASVTVSDNTSKLISNNIRNSMKILEYCENYCNLLAAGRTTINTGCRVFVFEGNDQGIENVGGKKGEEKFAIRIISFYEGIMYELGSAQKCSFSKP